MRAWLLIFCLVSSPAWAGEALTLVATGGGEVELSPVPGQTVLLHFWATWCPSCAVDMVALQEAADRCSADVVRIVLVNVGESEPVIARYFDAYGIELPVLLDPDGEAFRNFGGRGLPMNVEWTKDGLLTDVSPRSERQWHDRLVELGCAVSS